MSRLPCPRDDARADLPERADSDRSLLQRRRAPRTPQERSGAPPCSLPRGCCSVAASVRLCATPRTGALQAPLPMGLPGKNTEWVAMPCSRGPSWPPGTELASPALRADLDRWATGEVQSLATGNQIFPLASSQEALHSSSFQHVHPFGALLNLR